MAERTPVDRAWLSRHPVEVAWELVGCVLRIERDGVVVCGRIIETEAYAGPRDPASHASRLAAARQVMLGEPGIIYSYLSYGIHTMMNIVAHEPGEGGAVLLRALEPLEGLEVMHGRRKGVLETRLAQGPGSLGQAMGIRLTDLGNDLICAPEWDLLHGEARGEVLSGPRIGISKAVMAPWRFFEAGNPHVSRTRRGHPVGRQELPSLIPPPGTPIE